MSLWGKAREASSHQLGRETQSLLAVGPRSPQNTRGPVPAARPRRPRASPRAPPTSDGARTLSDAGPRPLEGAARAGPRRPIPGHAAASRLRVGVAAGMGFRPGGGAEAAAVPFSLSLPPSPPTAPPLPGATGFYFRPLAPGPGQSTCSLRPLGVPAWAPGRESLTSAAAPAAGSGAGSRARVRRAARAERGRAAPWGPPSAGERPRRRQRTARGEHGEDLGA